MQNADRLAADFGIAGILGFETTAAGLVKANVACDGVEAELFLQGAQLTRWAPHGGHPVIFTSPYSAFAPGKAIRGGIPVIFPWFGPHPTNPALPQHGFARTAAWQLVSAQREPAGGLALTLRLEPQGMPGSDRPARVELRAMIGARLRLELAVHNLAAEAIAFEEALHTYFAVSDIGRAAVSGLEGRTYIDKTDNHRRKTQQAPRLELAGETDSVYLDTPDEIALADRGWGRRITIAKAEARSTIVWNPWAEKAGALADLGDAWRSMICVETGNVADNAIRLAAGAAHTMSTEIGVAAP